MPANKEKGWINEVCLVGGQEDFAEEELLEESWNLSCE
jgi:hypothetical protein